MRTRLTVISLAFAWVLACLFAQVVWLSRIEAQPTPWVERPSVAQDDEKNMMDRLKALEDQVQERQKRMNALETTAKSAVEKAFAEIDKLKKEDLIWGEWFFDHMDPTNASVVARPNRGFVGRSRTIRFLFPRELDEPPAILICVDFINLKKNAYSVQTKNVTTKGFDLCVETPTFWEHLRLSWVAIPNSSGKKAPKGQIIN